MLYLKIKNKDNALIYNNYFLTKGIRSGPHKTQTKCRINTAFFVFTPISNLTRYNKS